jgi:hypothetical protein
MREIVDMTSKNSLSTDDSGIETRVFRTMALAVGLAVVVSLPFAPWRVTGGLLVGGLLSLLNYHWLCSSIAAGFDLAVPGAEPRIKLAQYILRYFVLAIVVFAAYTLNLVSLPATLAGLCSFVIALFGEAFREVYFAIIHRKEIS